MHAYIFLEGGYEPRQGRRARSVGIYRLWRDGGFAVGALLAGILADAYGIPVTVAVVGALTAASGIIVAVRMRSTDHQPTTNPV